MKLTESQKLVLDWLASEAESAMRNHVKRIVMNAAVQAAHGNTEVIDKLRKVAGFQGVTTTNYLATLREELAKVGERQV